MRNALFLLLLPLGMTSHAAPPDVRLLRGVAAPLIATVSDGDFVARSYADGTLAPEQAGYRDVLTVMSRTGDGYTTAQLPVSNSVTAAPEVLAVSRDGRRAYVVERLGQRPAGATRVAQLPPGDALHAIDLSDPSAPTLAGTLALARFPESVALSPDDRRLAVVSNTPEAAYLQIIDASARTPRLLARVDLSMLGIAGQADTPRRGVTATNVQWHPSGRYLAVNLNTQNRVAFFQLDDDNGQLRLSPWGAPVATGPDPFVGRFTPDGRHYLTSNWGRDFSATTLDGRIPQAPSTISVIRLDQDTTPPRHAVVDTATTGNSAEGLAISPDGRLVATINMRTTAFPPDSPRFTRDASVTLLRFEPGQGRLEPLGEYPFEGVLPEGGSFDLDGRHLLVTVFEGHLDAGPGLSAGLEVFRVVERDGRPALERRGRLPMPHGVHHVVVAGAR
ncbi:lactonase family protein [Bordetella sp. 2513F-2]